MGNITETTNNLSHTYHLSKGTHVTPEENKMLQKLIQYRDEYTDMWLKPIDKNLHILEQARFLGQAQGMKILIDLMFNHYSTKEGELDEVNNNA